MASDRRRDPSEPFIEDNHRFGGGGGRREGGGGGGGRVAGGRRGVVWRG